MKERSGIGLPTHRTSPEMITVYIEDSERPYFIPNVIAAEFFLFNEQALTRDQARTIAGIIRANQRDTPKAKPNSIRRLCRRLKRQFCRHRFQWVKDTIQCFDIVQAYYRCPKCGTGKHQIRVYGAKP